MILTVALRSIPFAGCEIVRSYRHGAALVVAIMLSQLAVTGCRRSVQHGDDLTDRPSGASMDGEPAVTHSPHSDVVPEQMRQIRQRRVTLDQTVWAEEVQAQRFEEPLVQLWDLLRSAPSWDRVKREIQRLSAGYGWAVCTGTHPYELSVQLETYAPGDLLDPAEMCRRLEAFQQSGYRLVQCEWHQRAFASGPPTTAQWDMTLHVENPRTSERLIVEGQWQVRWSTADPPRMESAHFSQLKMWRRAGPAVFQLAGAMQAPAILPNDVLAVYDVNRDGKCEIIFGHQIYRPDREGGFHGERLIEGTDDPIGALLIADLTGDGHVDLLCARGGRPPQVYPGNGFGRFDHPLPQRAPLPKLDMPMTISGGDIDHDADVDVWLGQYKPPYKYGQMPTPYYDANDGYPAYLLVNDGTGQLHDGTVPAGLSAKRHRRTYSSSFVDWDRDEDLDLVVVSDFAGVDLFQNDGDGRFHDASEQLLDDRHNFGMSHICDDFDADGQIDLYVTGMSSTTARRLESMRAVPPESIELTRMRPAMGFGNRLFVWRSGRFEQTAVRDQVARTGWSWGAVSLDFDNDGDRDIYVGNGHISGPSARDYCSHFWRHDIYSATSQPNPVWEELFQEEQQAFAQSGSWNGYEHNVLLANLGDRGFANWGFLLGVACEFDTRSVVSHDIDEDGRVDLLVVQNSRGSPPILHVFRNHLESNHRWIAVRLEDRPGRPALGTFVRVIHSGRSQVRAVVSGDSFTAQHPAILHFGLGNSNQVEQIEVHFTDGTLKSIVNPALDQVHPIPSE